jgi:hypothetical protein
MLQAWRAGEDPAFFKQLGVELAAGKHGALNPSRVGFHGWSGGAQMVSNLAHVWAVSLSLPPSSPLPAGWTAAWDRDGGPDNRAPLNPALQAGLLPGIEMKAGVMMSGGSQQCYNAPPLATAQCAGCDPSYDCMTAGCSGAVAKGTKPCCNMCCPQGATEQW